ncbi:hypothetical protein [Vagococcus carniphilus]|uniref:DUF5658 domain-containing protein n=1 Tax=Vagococcus carniphilus TaxID=218144 RepID=A0AAW8U0W1_9ENTE|nr:hypothetical protein [Vagococcus carniphilus]MDT2814418.1 hypothetical protein [Vagococcus carniphilus]MDT2829472.1 hypothetical protein [Vagococcus carniphilus]MDT2833186.1 hypothetical protein [Vagococcus carniphilus]MDT2838931.1 hypothetical protein [Vagococcus carniphilus]MDT2852989.1 hypothetical protein [Vagococcus carniphilus]
MATLLMLRWYLLIFGVIYFLIVKKLSQELKHQKIILIYSVVIQIFFLVYFFYTSYQLMNPKQLPIPMEDFNRFASILEYFYLALSIPLYSLLMYQLSKKMSKFLLIGVGIMLLSLFYIAGFIYILLTYGFAP